MADEDLPYPRQRKIIHVDMDAFFASVEQRDNPDLRGKPIAVGGGSLRGVVAAASYEARKYGVRSAMPSVTARRKCPELIFVPHRFEVYRSVSRQIRDIFALYTPLIEPLSLDEAYLDVTENIPGISSATQIAEEIRTRIKAETHLTASAGVSYNKFLAKLASDQNKPDGLYVIPPKMGPAFVESLDVGRFHGVGPATTARMNRLGIFTGLDLKAQTLEFLQQHFGKSGQFYFNIARGIDNRSVKPDRERKSLGAEDTFFTDVTGHDEAVEKLARLIAKVWGGCEKYQLHGRCVTLKVKYSDFHVITRSRTGHLPVGSEAELTTLVHSLLEPLFPVRKGIRLLGVSLSSFGEAIEPATASQLAFEWA